MLSSVPPHGDRDFWLEKHDGKRPLEDGNFPVSNGSPFSRGNSFIFFCWGYMCINIYVCIMKSEESYLSLPTIISTIPVVTISVVIVITSTTAPRSSSSSSSSSSSQELPPVKFWYKRSFLKAISTKRSCGRCFETLDLS